MPAVATTKERFIANDQEIQINVLRSAQSVNIGDQ